MYVLSSFATPSRVPNKRRLQLTIDTFGPLRELTVPCMLSRGSVGSKKFAEASLRVEYRCLSFHLPPAHNRTGRFSIDVRGCVHCIDPGQNNSAGN